MRVLEINSLEKGEGWIYYMQRYKGIAVIEIPGQELNVPVKFSIEIGPLGNKTIEVDDISNAINYPVFPIMKALKEHITTLTKEGALP